MKRPAYLFILDVSFLNLILKSGNKADITKFRNILTELENHPTIGIRKPELLKHDLSGYWS